MSLPKIRIVEAVSQGRLQTHKPKIVFADLHSLHRLAAIIANQEIEGPVIARDSLKRSHLLVPFHPLLRCPPSRAVHLFPIRAHGLNQHELLRFLIGGGVSSTPWIKLKTADVAPIPRASVSAAITRECRALPEHAESVAEIQEQIWEKQERARFAMALAQQCRVAKLAASR